MFVYFLMDAFKKHSNLNSNLPLHGLAEGSTNATIVFNLHFSNLCEQDLQIGWSYVLVVLQDMVSICLFTSKRRGTLCDLTIDFQLHVCA